MTKTKNALVFSPDSGPSGRRRLPNIKTEVNQLRTRLSNLKYTVAESKPTNRINFTIRRREVLKKRQLREEIKKIEKQNTTRENINKFKTEMNNAEQMFKNHKERKANIRLSSNNQAALNRQQMLNNTHNQTRENTRMVRRTKLMVNAFNFVNPSDSKLIYNGILKNAVNKKNLQTKIINLVGRIIPGKEEEVFNIASKNMNNEFSKISPFNLNKNPENIKQKLDTMAFAISVLREAIDMKRYNSFLNYMTETNPGNATYNINTGTIRLMNNPSYWEKWATSIGAKTPLEFNTMIRPNIGRPFNNNSKQGYTRQQTQNFKS